MILYHIDLCEDINYNILNDATRNENYGSGQFTDDEGYSYDQNISPDWKGEGWYQFQSPAGDKMTENVMERYQCGTSVSGWLNGTHPTYDEETVTRTVCGSWSSSNCQWSVSIKIKKCNNTFLYYLPDFPINWGRYCGAGTISTSPTTTSTTTTTSTGNCLI